MEKKLAILVVAYKRPEALKNLLRQVAQIQPSAIYIALDSPKSKNDIGPNSECIRVIEDWENTYPGNVFKKYSAQNLGCSISIIDACNWVFSTEEFVVVLEDDCFPSKDFFKLVQDSREYLETRTDLVMVCGTQFVPTAITHNRWSISRYPMIWGWATTRSNWLLIQEFFMFGNHAKLTKQSLKLADYVYWSAGARRGLDGFVDAWDTPLAFFMQSHGLRAILPGQNLVTNIGDDEAATHTRGATSWIRMGLEHYQADNLPPVENQSVDKWLRQNFYRVSLRHLFTTNATWMLDFLGINKRKRSNLQNYFSKSTNY